MVERGIGWNGVCGGTGYSMWWNREYSGIVIEGTCMQGRGQTDLGVLGEECDGHW